MARLYSPQGGCLTYCYYHDHRTTTSTTTTIFAAVCCRSSESPQLLDLRKSFSTLMCRCTALEDKFTTIDSRIDSLVAAHAVADSKLSTVVEAQQSIISAITIIYILTNRMDFIGSQLEKLCESL